MPEKDAIALAGFVDGAVGGSTSAYSQSLRISRMRPRLPVFEEEAELAKPRPQRPSPPGNRTASVKAAVKREAKRPPGTPLTKPQQVMRDALIGEHSQHMTLQSRVGTLHPDVATDAVRGAQRITGTSPGGGADILLANGKWREVKVYGGRFTTQGIGTRLIEKAAQKGTNEIYLQITSTGATRQGLLEIIPSLRSGFHLEGIYVKIFGPDGKVWWNGVLRGLKKKQ